MAPYLGQEWLMTTGVCKVWVLAASAPPISSGLTITQVLAATKASKVKARNPKVIVILYSRFQSLFR